MQQMDDILTEPQFLIQEKMSQKPICMKLHNNQAETQTGIKTVLCQHTEWALVWANWLIDQLKNSAKNYKH